ncbi:MAG TPA: hypothetical protein VEA37_03435, partial [Flavobacterium sp.]|nr:hypothetical protein [Flavobacterium sp.]
FLLVMAQAAMLPSDSGYNENRSDLVLIMALMAGLLMEIYSPRQLGLFLVSFPILAYLTRYVTDRWLDRGINIQTTSLLCLLGGIILPFIVMYSAGYFSFRYLILSLLLSTLVVIPAALIAYVRIGR